MNYPSFYLRVSRNIRGFFDMNTIRIAMNIVADYFKNEMIFYIKHKLGTDKRWCLRALQRIYENQTFDEQIQNVTKEFNKIGFSSNDAEIISDIWKFYNERNFLTQKQLNVCFRIMPKYAKQIIERVPTFRKEDLWKLMDKDQEYQRYRKELMEKKKVTEKQMEQLLFPNL